VRIDLECIQFDWLAKSYAPVPDCSWTLRHSEVILVRLRSPDVRWDSRTMADQFRPLSGNAV
jgi:hypothetical protein